MDPAPGYDPFFPHDLQHLIVEQELQLNDGIFGRIAAGGNASTFHAVAASGKQHKRKAARARRRLKARESKLAGTETSDFALSESATYVVWHDWLVHCDEPALQRQGHAMAATAKSILERLGNADRRRLLATLATVRVRVDGVARQWNALPIGGALTIPWP